MESLAAKSTMKNSQIFHSKAKGDTSWEHSADIWEILLTAGCQDPDYSRDVHNGLKDETLEGDQLKTLYEMRLRIFQAITYLQHCRLKAE